MYYDPLELTNAVRNIVVRASGGIEERKYYRFRGGRWYGGIATADCVGCNLRCKFCWSWRVRDNAGRIGRFYEPEHVVDRLLDIVKRRGYVQVRVSGGEPTISMRHLERLLMLFDERAPNVLFILETNGIVIGSDRSAAKRLSGFKRLHVRVSLKGCDEREFSMLTGAKPEAFRLQLQALKNLLDAGVSCHPAVMLSFSVESSFNELVERLAEIDEELVKELEEEYVFLYAHVKEILRRHGLTPRRAFSPDSIPEELI
uniref:Radical SAM protein n=1 Tax=Fervidicoccus fontis TaxID=683846 RepID=A0A7J3ZLU8_9CREN